VATIFLAHATADRDHARALASGLHSAGFTLLADPAPAGDDGWWAGLLAAVQDADILLYATHPDMPPDEASPVVAALRDYAVGIGVPTLELHFSGAGEATGIDFRRPTADAAFLLVGAIAARPERPVAGWQVPPVSPFARLADLARDVRATTISHGDRRRLVDRLRTAAGDPAARELAAVLRRHPDLDADSIGDLDRTFPENAEGLAGSPGTSETPGTSATSATSRTSATDGTSGTSGTGGTSGIGIDLNRTAGPGAGSTAWQAPAGGLGPENVRSVFFRKAPFGRRGYDEEQVDVFLDKVEQDLKVRYAGGTVVQVRLTAADVHAVSFVRPPRGRRGYNEEEVDAFLDEIQRTVAALDQALAEHGIAVVKR
jgi:DivIVA domain-containing protein